MSQRLPSLPNLDHLKKQAKHVLRLCRRAANAAAAQQGKQQQAFIAVDYDVDFEEITVTGDHAFAWGTYHSTVRPRDGGAQMTYSGKLMRILQRQPDGAWKMHRTMMTADPQTL